MTFESRLSYLDSFKITHTFCFVFTTFSTRVPRRVCSGWFSFYFNFALSTHCPRDALYWYGVKWFTPNCLSTGITALSKQLQHTQEVYLRIHFTNSLPSHQSYRKMLLSNQNTPHQTAKQSLTQGRHLTSPLCAVTLQRILYHWWSDNKRCVLVWKCFSSYRFRTIHHCLCWSFYLLVFEVLLTEKTIALLYTFFFLF